MKKEYTFFKNFWGLEHLRVPDREFQAFFAYSRPAVKPCKQGCTGTSPSDVSTRSTSAEGILFRHQIPVASGRGGRTPRLVCETGFPTPTRSASAHSGTGSVAQGQRGLGASSHQHAFDWGRDRTLHQPGQGCPPKQSGRTS